MSKTVLDSHIADPLHNMSRATAAVADAIEDGIHAVRRVGKTGSDAAEEFIEDAKERVKRHPTGTVAAAFAVGAAFGALVLAVTQRK